MLSLLKIKKRIVVRIYRKKGVKGGGVRLATWELKSAKFITAEGEQEELAVDREKGDGAEKT